MSEESKDSQKIFTSVTRKTLLALINSFLMGLVGIISWTFVARNMPIGYVGIVYFAMGFGGMFSFVVDLGFGAAHVKRISEGEDVGRCIGTFMAIKSVLIIVFVIIVVTSIFVWKNVMGRGFNSPNHELMIYIMVGYYIAIHISRIGSQTLIAKIETAKQQMIALVGALVQLVATLFVVLFTDDIVLFGMTFVIGGVANMIIASFFLFEFKIKMPTLRLTKSYIIFALPIFVIYAIAVIPINVDRVIIQLFWDETHVGIYRGGQVFSQYLIQIPMGLGLILFPTISKLDAKGKAKQIRDLVYSTERLIAMVLAPVAALMFVLALPIVTIVSGPIYAESYLVLQPLTLWAFVFSINLPYNRLIMGLGELKKIVIISTAGVIAIVVFDLIFIPADIKMLNIELLGLSARGAALATLLSVMILFIMFRLFCYKYLKRMLNPSIFRFIIPAFVMGVIIYFANEYFPADRIYWIFLYGCLGMVIYLVIIVVTKGLTKDDIEFFRNVLDPVEMVRYVRHEVRKKKKH